MRWLVALPITLCGCPQPKKEESPVQLGIRAVQAGNLRSVEAFEAWMLCRRFDTPLECEEFWKLGAGKYNQEHAPGHLDKWP